LCVLEKNKNDFKNILKQFLLIFFHLIAVTAQQLSVHTFRVLPDEHDVDVVVPGLDAEPRLAVQDVDEQIKRVPQFDVARLQV
jgi:hypothetical protein